MSLNKRVFLIILITLTTLLGGLTFFIDRYVTDEFHNFDNDNITRHAYQVHRAFENAESNLAANVIDWGQWDNTYQFINDSNETYVHENLNYLTLSALHLRHLVYYDKNGIPVKSYEVFPRQEIVGEIPPLTLEQLNKIPKTANKDNSGNKGIAILDDSIVFYATSPILDTSRESVSRGTLLFTIAINHQMLSTIAEQTNLSLTVYRIGVDLLGQTETGILKELNNGSKLVTRKIENGLLNGYGLIRDTNQNPAILFRIDNPRTNFLQGIRVSNTMQASVIIAGIVWMVITLLLLNYWILRPLTKLSTQVNEIAKNKDASLKVSTLNTGRSLKLRAIVIIASTMVILTSIVSLVVSTVFEHEFAQIEQSAVLDDVQRVERAIGERKENLLSKTIDWAQWDDTYQFILDQNNDYQESNITVETLGAIGMSHVLFFDSELNFATGWSLDPEGQTISKIDKTSTEQIQSFTDFAKNQDGNTTGYVGYSGVNYLVAKSPILDTTRTKPSRGVFMFVMPLDENFIKSLATQTELKIVSDYTNDISSFTHIDQFNNGSSVGILDETTIIGQLPPLTDPTGKTLLNLEVVENRDIYQHGQKIERALIFWLLGVSLVFVLVTVFSLQRWVINRVFVLKNSFHLNSDINGITNKDELSMLSLNINSMLSSLNEAQEEIVKARDAAESANQAKSSFIAKVSHELRTPIHGIIGMLRIVLKQEQNPFRRSHLGMAKDAAYSLLNTINDILDFSKAEAGMLSVTPVEFQLDKTLRDALRTVAPRVYERDGLEILCDIPGSLPNNLIGDPVRLKQILVNLLGNSAKFTNSGYVKLTIGVHSISNGICTLNFDITDTGIGIPEDRLPTIFEPFTQADNSNSRRYQGTGLGLTIVKQLVEAMGGNIGVTSKLGVGTTFKGSIPFQVSKSTFSSIVPDFASIRDRTFVVIDHFDIRSEITRKFLFDNGAQEVYLLPITVNTPNPILVVTGEMILKNEIRKYLDNFVTKNGAENVIALLTPIHLTLREELYSLGIRTMLNRPVLEGDLLAALRGELIDESGEEREVEAKSFIAPSKRRVLIADDTPTNLIILRDLLEERGFEVTSVADGQEILSTMSGYLSSNEPAPFDIILSDVQMPQVDGVTAVQEIRKSEEATLGKPSRHIPVVMVTAHAFPEEIQRLHDAGADGVVTKPIEPEELASVLDKVLL